MDNGLLNKFKNNRFTGWKFKNTFLLILSLIIFIFLIQTPLIDKVIKYIGSFGYISAFFSGVFFISTFTVVPSSVILFHLSEFLNPYIVALLAGIGAMLGDYIVFRFIKDKVFEEWYIFFKRFKLPRIKKLFKTPYFAWMLPVLGAIIIASPIPDEIGISLLGLSKIKKWQFFIITFVLNTVGILIIILSAQLVK